tara:strand:- start:137 stop:859 length:723 start_codon:yes stop_codon:yes gene_type:complete
MAEGMNYTQILQQEYNNTGTSWTRNEFFDRNGYLIIKNLCDPKKLFHPVPELRGQLNYRSKDLNDFKHIEVEGQVEGSIARYWHPQYRDVHTKIRLILEQAIGRKLYNTYYYDRFYFPGQALTIHADRPACEISVSVHVSTNLKENWPIWIKTPDTFADNSKMNLVSKGENRPVDLEPGDGMVYKGCERPHWRDPMPGLLETSIEKAKGNNAFFLYYHQIFFHYVLQDGIRAHHAWDMAR